MRFLTSLFFFKQDPRGKRKSARYMNKDRWGDIYSNTPVRKMIALYDYDPQELSPNVDAEVELKFHTGDLIYVYGEMDDDGFYLAELRGQRGLVPSNFLTEATNTEYNKKLTAGGVQPAVAAPAKATGMVGGMMGGLANAVGIGSSTSGAAGPPPPPRGD